MIEFIGRFHPLLVHLPIGFLVLLGIFEVLGASARAQSLGPAVRVVLWLTFPVSLASIICGWLLANRGDYDGQVLFWHRWLGTGLAVTSAALLACHARAQLRMYRWTLVGTLGLLVVASHFGASLTHGSDFLSWPKPKPAAGQPVTNGDLGAQVFYTAVIQPIFNQSCVNCHGPNKAKGSLRLDTVAHLLNGGDSGSPLEPPGSARSLLGKRLALPLEVEEHMPPDGKRQLSANELALLNWWLDAGAPTDKTIDALQLPPPIAKILGAAGKSPTNQPAGSQ